MRLIKLLLMMICVLPLVSCTRSASVENATLQPADRFTAVAPVLTDTPTFKPVISSATPVITATFLPTSIPVTPTLLTGTPPPTPTTDLPKDVPLKVWKELPIMPGAITGEELPDRYRFLLSANVGQVGDYYKKELPKLGWKFVTSGTGENGAPIFIFSKGKTILSISVIVLGKMAVVSLAPI
jgi:hypothetical protein